MLRRNCIKRLFHDGDLNIPITVLGDSLKSDSSFYNRSVWFSTIQSSLGTAITTSEQIYTFQITSIKGKIYTIHSSGKQIIEELRNLFSHKAPLSIRIDILEDSDQSWIILIKSDLN